MTMRTLSPLLILAAAAAGCQAGSASSGGNFRADAGVPAGGAGGLGGGGIAIKVDAGVVSGSGGSKGDASAYPTQVPPNLATDAPVFVWGDAQGCTNCGPADASVSALDGAKAGGGGGAGSGAGGKTGSGGTTGSGTTGSGGSSGTGGATGKGGSSGSNPDAPVQTSDARTMDGGALDVGTAPEATAPRDASSDPSSPADALPPDLKGPDSMVTDVSAKCVARIRALVPAIDLLGQSPLVAGANVQVVLRAEIASGAPASVSWSWQGSRDGQPVPPAATGATDLAAAAFPIAVGGTYTFTVTDKTFACSASVQVPVVAANACPACDKSVILRAAPPPAADFPVQSGAIGLSGSAPFGQTNVVLAKGVSVLVAPSVGSNLVASYVRVIGLSGDLVADGLADPRAGFGARLLDMDNNRALLKYDVLVVPIDGTNGGTVAATAPMLFQSLTPAQINSTTFRMAGGVTVTGNAASSGGQGVVDARVMLTNRDPSAPAQPSDLIFSSVGSGDAQGNFVLHAQKGQYWVSVSPPTGSGLAEALAPTPIELAGDATISFQWNALTNAVLTLNVRDASGSPIDGTRVRLTSSQATSVGMLTVVGSGVSSAQPANGNVRVEGTTSAGTVTFASLPVGAYNVLLVPAILGVNAATTLLSVTVPAGGPAQTVQLSPQSRISGNLLSGAAGSAPDWTRVNLVAYDRSADTPEAPRAVSAGSDGSFSIGVSPGRPYVVLAVPETSSGLARTFVGPGPLAASEFTITQKVQASMDWIATVMDENQSGLGGTALQVFCGPTWPSCIDATIPLAETTSEDSGAFQLALADPATR